ncbi:hypothetical protein [Streptomyces sp. NRRL B-3229]|uniref:hypothetical protein n=1 Tax=Streptomyces sp. NRRL B-3229 TaxID=1463836 RepID=UPI0004C08C51|nr:hypothetical protein [Streptomyces sp. NRRL B-3229]
MSRTPDPGAPESNREEDEEPWLHSDEVSELWQVRKHWLPSVAALADVRSREFGGESRGTYGAAPTFHHYHPGDARRAASTIAEGGVEIPSTWRLDTPAGRLVEKGSLFAFRLGCLVVVALVLSMVLLLVHALASS